jgi:hypothetical protein
MGTCRKIMGKYGKTTEGMEVYMGILWEKNNYICGSTGDILEYKQQYGVFG